MRLVLASRNENKLRELRRALPDWEIELLDAPDEPVEDAETFLGNARIKARHGRLHAHADETGSPARTRGSRWSRSAARPGVESARWAEDGVARLLAELGGVADRRARYVCELVALEPRRLGGPSDRHAGGRGRQRAARQRGVRLRPDLRPDGESSTVAELGDAWKSEHSHRARAARALAAALARDRGSVAPMDAAQALAELTELSSQVERAVVFDADGIRRSHPTGDERRGLARRAVELLAAAGELHPSAGDVTRAEVELAEGGLFVAPRG